jgi:hypothetical protein
MEPDSTSQDRPEVERDQNTHSGSPQMYVSLSQAAKMWGKSKNTISMDIKKGKLQWIDLHGGRKLMLGQLSEVYGPLDEGTPRTSQAVADRAESEHAQNAQNDNEINMMRAVLQAKEEQISLLKEQLERERLHAERWHKAFEEIKLLPAPAREAEAPRKKFLGIF